MNLLDTSLVGQSPWNPARFDGHADILVLGVGNLLMGDEGVGIHVIRALERQEPMQGVRLLDGGTGGIILLEEIQACPHVILVDATRDGSPAGTIAMFRAQTPTALPQGLSAHDFGLKDLFAASAVLGAMPEVQVITVSVEVVHPMCLKLTPAVAASVTRVIERVRSLVDAARIKESAA